MGRCSTRKNKNVYQLSRERAGLTRSQASDLMEGVTADRIEKIESERSRPHADEVLLMARAYENSSLCNYFCTHECPIGERNVPEVSYKHLSQIILEILSSLNKAEKEKDRLVEITADSWISEEEYDDFLSIKNELTEISSAVEALKLWADQRLTRSDFVRDSK
ncbi:MAG: helix-turn-helix domain-containing protein [Lachnospiraceae bacterium]|nr:helix-turn-helix domain-containing protein [Lachnospiraceae bacterium]